MSYRKFTADQVFTGYTMLNDSTVLITNKNGTIVDLVPLDDAGDDIEKLDGIISPGFINCHCHLELSHMKGIAQKNSGMIDFLLTVMNGRNSDKQTIVGAIEKEEHNMKESGIVAVGDICNTTYSIDIKKRRDLYYHNFIEATGFVEASAADRFSTAFKVYR